MSEKKFDASNVNVRKEIVRGVVHLIRQKQFYGHILQQLQKVYIEDKDHQLGTMAVGRRRDEILIKLFINIPWVKSIFEKYGKDDGWERMVGVLEHEVLHLVFNHLTLDFTDRNRSAVAVDCVVNSCVDRNRLPEPGCFAEDYGFPPHKSAFWYYQQLKDNDKYKKQCKSGAFGNDGAMSMIAGSHELWDKMDEDPIMKEYIKDIIRKSKDLCNGDYGSVPGEVIDAVDQILKTSKPIVPWNKVLRTFCASATESSLSYTMKKISKRYGTRPGTRKEDVLNIAVAVDTSGSISQDQLLIFFNEIKWIWKNGATITVYEADCQICDVYKFRGKWKGDVKGRGGTHLEPVLAECEKKYDALIYFTDFYAPKIEKKYNIPILWVLTTELSRDQFPYEWGRHIKIDSGVAEAI